MDKKILKIVLKEPIIYFGIVLRIICFYMNPTALLNSTPFTPTQNKLSLPFLPLTNHLLFSLLDVLIG